LSSPLMGLLLLAHSASGSFRLWSTQPSNRMCSWHSSAQLAPLLSLIPC
jgi:hypothetical protein